MAPIPAAQVPLPGLDDTTVAVTGAASGIGRAVAALAARSGARVVAGDMNEDALRDLETFAAGEHLAIEPVLLDVSDPISVAAFVEVADRRGDLFGLVNSAGISPYMPVLEIPFDLWSKVLTINLTGTFLVAQAAARAMVAHGKGGSIVNISSGSQLYGAANLGHYNASKAGVISLSKTMARELGAYDIRVNTVCPGSVDTPLWRSHKTDEEIQARQSGKGPMQRVGQPEDLANGVGFLLSSLSPWITGQTHYINGGATMP